jgi:hypothetical protein
MRPATSSIRLCHPSHVVGMLRHALLTGALACTQSALAGRPLSSDDAGTADAVSCQLEGWGERAGANRALVLAPACGVLEGLEFGAEYTYPHPRDEVRGEAGLAVKWAPKSWAMPTAVGQLAWGLKAGLSFERPTGAGWQRTGQGLLGLATLNVSEDFALHANLGPQFDRASRSSATAFNLAAVWMPSGQYLLFAELQSNDRRDVFGAAMRTIGGLWWLSPDKLGLSITASRQNGSSQTLWTAGFGWYGLEF